MRRWDSARERQGGEKGTRFLMRSYTLLSWYLGPVRGIADTCPGPVQVDAHRSRSEGGTSIEVSVRRGLACTRRDAFFLDRRTGPVNVRGHVPLALCSWCGD